MSLAWLARRGDVRVDTEHLGLSWACSGCRKCQEECEHKNPVFETLLDARADAVRARLQPPRIGKLLSLLPSMDRRRAEALRKLEQISGVDHKARRGLLVGCGYVKHAPAVARDIVKVAVRVHEKVRVVRECCGLPWLYAGDRLGFEVAQARLRTELFGLEEVSVADPGCVRHVPPEVRAVPLVTLLGERVDLFPALSAAALNGGLFRFHDPCLLGRGLGVYEAPRRLLERLLGRAPEEFVEHRQHSNCSGAGGLLACSFPTLSKEIGRARVEEHEAAGGGTIVTACAMGLHQFARLGRPSVDLHALAARAIPPS